MATSAHRGPILVVLLALVVAVLAVFAFGGSEADDTEQIQQAIRQVAEAGEEADLPSALEVISTTYRDADGMDRDAIKGYLFVQFQKRGPVHLVLSPIAVDLEAGATTAEATFAAAIGEGGEGLVGELLPETGEVLEFRVSLQKEGEVWRITSHERFDLGGSRVGLPYD